MAYLVKSTEGSPGIGDIAGREGAGLGKAEYTGGSSEGTEIACEACAGAD